MNCKYMRIQGRDNAYRTQYPRGIFAICWRLVNDGIMSPEDEKLFDMAVAGGKKDGYKQMVIECQNTNVTAVNFYKKQGALLGKVDMYAYYAETGIEDEAQLLWYLDL